MILHPGDNIQVRAAFCGTLNCETPEHNLKQVLHPWAQQWLQDLQAVHEHDSDFLSASNLRTIQHLVREDHQLHVLFMPHLVSALLQFDPSHLIDYTDLAETLAPVPDPAPEALIRCDFPLPSGDACPYVGTRVQVALHRLAAHDYTPPYRRLIHTNECPVCRTVFTSRRTAAVHAQRSIPIRRCPDTTLKPRKFITELRVQQITEPITCTMCGDTVQGHDKIQAHMAAHMRTLWAQDAVPAP